MAQYDHKYFGHHKWLNEDKQLLRLYMAGITEFEKEKKGDNRHGYSQFIS